MKRRKWLLSLTLAACAQAGVCQAQTAPPMQRESDEVLPPLPAPWPPIATSHVKALEVLRQSDVDWTYVAPAAYFEPGERKGSFRVGTDELITDANGESRISMEDFAIALVDELETGGNRRKRISVGY